MTLRALFAVAPIAVAVLGAPAAASAQGRPPASAQTEIGSAGQVDAVIQCRAIADSAQRLQCYDAAAARLAEATQRRDIVVVDRNQVRETRRRLFGFSLPNIRLFGGGGRDRDGHDEDADEIRELRGTVASASNGQGGRWVVTLDDGGTWTQVDNLPLAIWPRRGTAVVIRRGLVGNYMMEVAGQPAIRVRRTG
jgi:hypothetical protein